jgi:hypothetical protein
MLVVGGFITAVWHVGWQYSAILLVFGLLGFALFIQHLVRTPRPT